MELVNKSYLAFVAGGSVLFFAILFCVDRRLRNQRRKEQQKRTKERLLLAERGRVVQISATFADDDEL